MNNNTNKEQKVKTQDPEAIVITLPNDLTGEQEEILTAIVESKQTLLKKALEADELPILVKDGKISFPWFKNHNIDGEVQAYTQLISALIKMAKEQKRVVAKDKQEENEKFAMRIFTVRLGLKGDEYKLLRKLLTHNLSGNSAWRNGAPKKDAQKSESKKPDTADKKPAVTSEEVPTAKKPEKTPDTANKTAKEAKKVADKPATKKPEAKVSVDGDNTK